MGAQWLTGRVLDSRPSGSGFEPQGGGGFSDIFIHTSARIMFFWLKILNFNIFLGFQKGKKYEDFVDMFLGSSQNWTIFRGYFYAI